MHVKFSFQPFDNLFFTDFTAQQRDMGHSCTSQKLIKLQPQTSQVATAEVEECSKMSICRLQRPIIKGCKSQFSSAAVQTSNHEFEQKRGLSANMCQKLSMGTLLEDATAGPRYTNQTVTSQPTVAASTLRLSKRVGIREKEQIKPQSTQGWTKYRLKK